MNDYLVFFRKKDYNHDIIVGMARNYKRAERMAENLNLDLRSRKIPVIMTGVKRVEHGQLYDSEECSLRWSVVPPEQRKTDENNT